MGNRFWQRRNSANTGTFKGDMGEGGGEGEGEEGKAVVNAKVSEGIGKRRVDGRVAGSTESEVGEAGRKKGDIESKPQSEVGEVGGEGEDSEVSQTKKRKGVREGSEGYHFGLRGRK